MKRSPVVPPTIFGGGTSVFDSRDLDEVDEGRDLAERLAVDTGLRARLVAYAWRRFGIRPSEAADILQDTCLSLLYSRGHIDRPEAFVFTVFHRRCCAAVGSSVRARGAPASPEGLFGDESTEDSIWLRQALARLSPRRRELIHSYFFEGHSLRKTARLCGVAETSIWTLLSRSVEKLRVEYDRTIGWRSPFDRKIRLAAGGGVEPRLARSRGARYPKVASSFRKRS